MNIRLKNIWNTFSDRYGRTLIHPQYIKKSLEYNAIIAAKKYAKGSLVDLGCGRMPYRNEFLPLVKTYVGVDHPVVSKLYKHASVKPDIFADIANLPFSRNTFDIAIMFQVLEYIPDPQKVFQEIARVLKRGGIVVLSVPFLYPIHDIPYDRARYTDTALKDFLRTSLLEIIKIEKYGSFIDFWLLSITVFLFKEMQETLHKKSTLLSVLWLIILLICSPVVVIICNSIVYLHRKVMHIKPAHLNYYPLDFLLIAKKKNV